MQGMDPMLPAWLIYSFISIHNASICACLKQEINVNADERYWYPPLKLEGASAELMQCLIDSLWGVIEEWIYHAFSHSEFYRMNILFHRLLA